MDELYFHFLNYLQTGGITMYPLVLCCLWMWVLIFFHLPLWRCSQDGIRRLLQEQFLREKRNNARHNRQLYSYLLSRAYQESVQGLSSIKLLASIAPFLGLFGTVTGMINTFQSVASFGLGNPRALAAGISEAMITTQFGLLIALPGILAAFFLQRRACRDQKKLQ
ncbi:MotA/TolQ/ExbB proton channel family protein, partial [bacterium AH-315-P11]|nr:MotA/TolQ/ExbB proton channel family protein [bacterium AH-315-P11]